jgi:hypothetical protein
LNPGDIGKNHQVLAQDERILNRYEGIVSL